MRSLSRRAFLKALAVNAIAAVYGNILAGCRQLIPEDEHQSGTAVPADGRIASAFYLDAANGNDSNPGTSPSLPWKTIDKMNKVQLSPGDSVLLKSGEKWLGTTILGQDGVSYGSYGDGPRPLIDGTNTVNCLWCKDKEGIRLENLTLANGIDSCAHFNGSSSIVVSNCEMYGAGNDNLIFINGCSHCAVLGGSYHSPYQRQSGTLVSCIEIADNGTDFLIDGVEVYNSPSAGITIHNHGSSDPQGRTDIPSSVTLRNLSIHGNGGNGINIMAQDATAPTRIDISAARIWGNRTGIRISKTEPSPLFPYGRIRVQRSKIIDNEVYGFYVSGDNVSFVRCLTAGKNQQNIVDNARNCDLHNLTISVSPDSPIFPVYIKGDRVNEVSLRNNIIFGATQAGQMIGTAAGAVDNVTIDYTLYSFPMYLSQARWMWNGDPYTYEDWKSIARQDQHSPTITDPLFMDASNGDFALREDSEAIDIGLDIGMDFLGPAPDLGYLEAR